MRGPYGWERVATAFMKDGTYLAASADHYSVGGSKQDGDDLEIAAVVTQYGDVRAVFGRKSTQKLEITSKCKIKKNRITGTSKAKGIEDFEIRLRLTRLAGLD